MILDVARLLLFPALMAFGGRRGDLITMTISNRVSLGIGGGLPGFWAILSGMGLTDILSQSGLAGRPASSRWLFACFAMGWVGGGRRQGSSQCGALVRISAHLPELSGLCLTVRRAPFDAAAAPVPAMAVTLPAGRPDMGCFDCMPRKPGFPTAPSRSPIGGIGGSTRRRNGSRRFPIWRTSSLG